MEIYNIQYDEADVDKISFLMKLEPKYAYFSFLVVILLFIFFIISRFDKGIVCKENNNNNCCCCGKKRKELQDLKKEILQMTPE